MPTSAQTPYFALLAAVLWAPNASAEVAGPPSLAEIQSRDAQLHDLAFVDGRHGWAVGDRGVILKTVDGGRRWVRVESSVDCPLYSVAFVDHLRGWAVGGTVTPYTHTSRATVLRTVDGGDTWRPLPTDTLPLLRRVQFFDDRNGVVLGASTDFAPGGVFETQDGGRSWRSLPTERTASWLAADFVAPGIGVLAGERGAIAAIAGHQATPIDAAQQRRGLHGLSLVAPNNGWVVGDGGLVLATEDRGETWRAPEGQLPEAVRACDWRGVAVEGERVWIAGAPGSVVLHSPDGGRSWRRQPTGVTAPLSAITFVDERRGWAAGAFGTLLATVDGGRSWRVQRRGGERASTLLLTAGIEQTPLDLIASLGAGEGHLVVVDLPFAPVASDETQAATRERLHESATASGAAATSVGWRLPLSRGQRGLPAERLTTVLDAKTGGQSEEELTAPITKLIRMHRPDVVLLSTRSLDASTGPERLLESCARLALTAAADADRFPELAACGLTTHQATRLSIVAPAGPRTTPRLATGNFDPLLATSPAQWVGPTRGLLTAEYEPPPTAFAWRPLVGEEPLVAAGRNPLAGIAVARDGRARRRVAGAPVGELAELQAVAQKRRHMRQLLASRAGDDAWLGQAVNLTSGLDPDSGAELLYQLADGYQRAGKLELAAGSFYLIGRRYTNHPLADSALVWLMRYYASGEVGHAEALHAARRGAAGRPLANVADRPGVGLDLEETSVPGSLSREQRLERAARLGEYLEQARPALFADPAARFLIASARRGLGVDDASRCVTVLAKQRVAPAWRECAVAERWLQGADRLPPDKPIANCQRSKGRPKLDGRLDDPCWAEATRFGLGADQAPVVRVARDDEFLFVALDCPKRDGVDYPAASGVRPRDADLTQRDRVTLRIDVDRDYATWFELTIDSRGWTNDRCWGGAPWDPAWYVASAETGDRWLAEAAIPLAALTPAAVEPSRAWALAVERRVPGHEPQRWGGSSSGSSPDGFGLLLLERVGE